jgi:hypothetical protein
LVRGFLQCLSTTAREELYDRYRGDAEFPTCNICGQLILVGDAWDESHDPEGAPHCFGGTETGVAHRACDRRHGAEVVRPLDAKATRNRQKHVCLPDPSQAPWRPDGLAQAQGRRQRSPKALSPLVAESWTLESRLRGKLGFPNSLQDTRRPWQTFEFRRCLVTPFGGDDVHLVTNLQKFARFLERRLRAFPAMDYLAAILTVGLNGEAHFSFLRFFFRISAWTRKASTRAGAPGPTKIN